VTYRLVVGFSLFLAGCPVGRADDQDIDGGGGGDGSNATSGLTVTWGCTPDVPGPVTSDVLIEEVELEASSLRLIGDSAAPGDMRTTRAPLQLHWQSNAMPADIELGAAPPGLYSRIEIGTGGSDEHLRLRGRARVRGEYRDFDIEDQRPHAIVKNIVLSLAPGSHATIPVSMNLGPVMASIPFNDLDEDDGTLVFLDSNDPRLDAVWAAIDASVSVPVSFVIDR
jgi:hypothetical protein